MPDCLFSGFRVPVSPTVSSVLPDHHQSAAAVLCPAGQELPVLLREGEDSECYVAPWLPPSLSAPRRFTALSTLPSLWSSWIFNLPLVVFLVSFHLLLHWLLFLALGIFFALPRLSWLPHLTLLSLSPAVCADEQHPADEGPVGEDVWINGSQTGEMQYWPPSHVQSPGPKTSGLCELQQASSLDESNGAAWTVLRTVLIHLGHLSVSLRCCCCWGSSTPTEWKKNTPQMSVQMWRLCNGSCQCVFEFICSRERLSWLLKMMKSEDSESKAVECEMFFS